MIRASLIIEIMTAALTRSSCVSIFSFHLGGRLFHDNGPATGKLRGPKFWSAARSGHLDLPTAMATCKNCRYRNAVDMRYGAASW